MPPSKQQRLAAFFRKLDESVPVSTSRQAYKLICDTLTSIEDEFGPDPQSPDQTRMFPPLPENIQTIPGSSVEFFDSLRHRTYLGPNGSIDTRLAINLEKSIFQKAGSDGKKVTDFYTPR